MNESSSAKAIVVGAGIAGLTAAWQLNKVGIQTLVLEAEPSVGGRMKSIQIENALIDCGAQFLSNAYSIIPKLINEAGLSDQFVATNEWIGLVRNQNIALIHPQKPWHLVSNHLLSVWDFIRLGLNQFKLFGFQKKTLSLNDITTWVQYDNVLASNWVIKNFGEAVARELTATVLNGLYFQALNDSSASLAAAVTAFSAYNPQTMTLTGGMGSLPDKLAEKLNVRVGVTALAIEETATGVVITTNTGKFKAEHVILSIPAPIAKNIIQKPDAKTLPLLNTPYSSSALISLLTNDDWTPPANISSVYGFLFNPKWDSKIAALTIENNKRATRTKKGYLINVMLSDKWAKKMLHLTDIEIYREIQLDVEAVFPNIYHNLLTKKIFRWKYAMPYTPLGRAKTVKQYRDSRNSNNRVWLAGDYLGFPWTDSAAQTGIWAANQVRKSLLGISV